MQVALGALKRNIQTGLEISPRAEHWRGLWSWQCERWERGREKEYGRMLGRSFLS